MYLKQTKTIITYKFKGILKILIRVALCSSTRIFDFMIEFKGKMNPATPLIDARRKSLTKKLSILGIKRNKTNSMKKVIEIEM